MHRLRARREELGLSYVPATSVNQRVPTVDAAERLVDEAIAALPAQAWRARSTGDGAKGARLFDRARTPVRGLNWPTTVYWLLAPRSRTDPEDLACYLCHRPVRTTVSELVTVAGTRWVIEETIQTAKGQTGLDHYQVRH